MSALKSVAIACPTCRKTHEVESQTAPHDGEKYTAETAPQEIANGANGAEFICCGSTWMVVVTKHIRVHARIDEGYGVD